MGRRLLVLDNWGRHSYAQHGTHDLSMVHVAMTGASPGMSVIPSHLMRPPSHDRFRQCKWLGDPRLPSVWALSLLCLIQDCLTRFVLQVTPPSSRALPEAICFRHCWLVSSLLSWVSPSHLSLVCQAGSWSEGGSTIMALSCPSAFLQLQMLYSVWVSNDVSVMPTFLKGEV